MANDGGKKGTLRKGGYNVDDIARGHYNADKDNVHRAADFGTIKPEIREMFPLSKKRGGGKNDYRQ